MTTNKDLPNTALDDDDLFDKMSEAEKILIDLWIVDPYKVPYMKPTSEALQALASSLIARLNKASEKMDTVYDYTYMKALEEATAIVKDYFGVSDES